MIKVPEAHRYLPSRSGIHHSLLDPQWCPFPPTAPTPASPLFNQHRQRSRILLPAWNSRFNYTYVIKLYRRKPDLPADRGGRASIHERGLRELRQDSNESILQAGKGD
jgi:hypothetical protein